jgi:L-galactose dehydrogenase
MLDPSHPDTKARCTGDDEYALLSYGSQAEFHPPRTKFSEATHASDLCTLTMSGLPESFVPGWHDEAEVRQMKFRTLPHYGQVSIISFGASGLGGMFTAGQGTGLADAKAGAADEKEDVWFAEDADSDKQAATAIVQMCLKAGVNMIDTSHWYGQGRSERLLGHALKGVPRQAFYINSKIGRYDKDPMHMFDFTYEKTYQAG